MGSSRPASRLSARATSHSVRRSPRPYSLQSHLQARRRILLIWILLCLAALGLGGRLAYLQLWQQNTLQSLADQQQVRPIVPRRARRPITDRQGTPLAMDRLVYTVYAHPALFRQPISVVAETVSPLLEVPAATLVERLKVQPTGVRLGDNIAEATAERLQQLQLDGLELLPRQQRFYPQQALFAPIVGFINLDGEAQTGLEAYYEARLRLGRRSAHSSALAGGTMVTRQPSLSDSLQLQVTLDSRLQRITQTALQETLAQFGAKRGAVMVMDVHTGALHAFAVAPTFDPNRYFEADLAQLKNWAVTDLHEPGSTLKPINVAIALDAGVITPQDTVYDEGQIELDDWIIQNSDYESTGKSGLLTISEVLQHSSNVGMVHIMERLPAADYYEWLQRLEVDHPTGIDLPAENYAPLKDRQQFVNSPVDVATTAFGQGIVMTPLKLLQLQAAIANGGKLVTPHVLRGLVDDTGTLQWRPARPPAKPVFSAETTEAVLKMMESVVTDGTGEAAQIPGYRIAGKTGTAQKVTASGYYGDQLVASFVGVLPAEAPQFAVLVIIDEPRGEIVYGGTVAAPLAKTVMESLLVLEGIPPSSPQAFGGLVVSPEGQSSSPPSP